MPGAPRSARRLPGAGLLAAALAAALAAGGGCRPRTPPPDLSLEPRALLAQVERTQAAVRAVQGEARVRVKAPSGSGSLRQFLAAERPDRVHIEALDFFGNVAAVLVARDGDFALYDAREKVFYRGPATPENLARLVPLPLPVEDLVTILCGSAPLSGEPVEAAPGRGFVTLRLAGDGVEQELRIGAGATVERSSREVAGGAGPGSYELELERYRSLGGAWFPLEVRLRSAPASVRLDLAWSEEVEVNGEISPDLFQLAPPRGARVVEVGAGEPGT